MIQASIIDVDWGNITYSWQPKSTVSNNCRHCLLLLLQLFYDSLDFIRDYFGEPVPEETFTHSHLSWSSIIHYLLPPFIMICGILPVQFTCLTVFLYNHYPGFLWSTSCSGTLHFILHTFHHPIIVFILQHTPIPSKPVLL